MACAKAPASPTTKWGGLLPLQPCQNEPAHGRRNGERELQDVSVHIQLDGRTHHVGLLRRQTARGRLDAVTFEYDHAWLANDARFALQPVLALASGVYASGAAGGRLFGAFADSAPDSWGRRLIQRAERRNATREGRQVRTLGEVDYLMGVSDIARLGALRFRRTQEEEFQAPTASGVPALVELPRLLASARRIERDEDSEDDLATILAPGSSLGGARPKASVIDNGDLSIAKFPKDTDEYSLETWEEIAFRLAEGAGIETPTHRLVNVAGRHVLLSRRFDRARRARIPFLSAMAMTGAQDGERGSYPELADELARHGTDAMAQTAALFRRMTFNVLISNVDDHLRNHGFLFRGQAGWTLSPAYDLNPTPVDLKARVLTTNIDLDDGTCSLDLLESVAPYFGLDLAGARQIIKEVAVSVATWRTVAATAGVSARQADRMASAFEHEDLRQALAL